MNGQRPAAATPLLFLVAAGLTYACTEDPLGTDPGTSPGETSPTYEFRIPADQLDWTDTTVSGFSDRVDLFFSQSGDREGLRSRTIARFPLPDTFRTFGDTLPADSFPSGYVRLKVDTTSSWLPGFPVTVTLHELTRSFDEREVSWEEARAGEPWTTPGGDIGQVLGSAVMETISDSMIIEFDVDVDSLLMSWTEDLGEPGFILLADPPGTQLNFTSVRLKFQAVLQGRSAAITQDIAALPRTFITDPPPPPTGLGLRIGGSPSARAYFQFTPPDTIDGIPVRGSTINHAQLIFHPLESPEEPFVLERLIGGRPVELLKDPFLLAERTPIGTPSPEVFPLDPDSLANGRPITFNITPVMLRQASLPPDSFETVRLGLRADPDAQSFGYWEIGSEEAPEGYRPEFLIILTPPADLRVK